MTVQFNWNGPAVSAALAAAAAQGLRLGAEHVLAEATKVVPLEEATLSRSGATDVDAATMTASISYDTPYAVRQHEELGFQHAAGRQAKYLEEPFNREAATVQKIIADQIGKVLK